MTENNEKKNSGKVTTPKFRLSFPSIFEPKKKMASDDLEYSIVMLFPKGTDLSSLKKLAFDACVAKWGTDKAKWPPNLRNDWKSYLSSSGKDGWPFRDGDMQEYDGYPGMISVRASSSNKPAVFDRRIQPIFEKDEVYAGCYCHASVTAYAWDHTASKNRGVSFGLLGIQKVEDGEPFTRRADPGDFTPYEDMSESAGNYSDDMDF